MRTEKQKQIEHDNTCFKKASSRGQRTFTLVEQDKSASKTIIHWILENWELSPTSKLQDAFDDTIAMRDSMVTKKVPD